MSGLMYINNFEQHQYIKKSSISGGGSIFQKYPYPNFLQSLIIRDQLLLLSVLLKLNNLCVRQKLSELSRKLSYPVFFFLTTVTV